MVEQQIIITIIIAKIIITANIRYSSYTMSRSFITNCGRDRLCHLRRLCHHHHLLPHHNQQTTNNYYNL